MNLLGKLKHFLHRATGKIELLSPKWEAKFWNNVDKSDECWVWTAAVSQRGSYGVFTVTGETQFRRFLAHRLAWQLLKGPLRRNEILFRLCDEPKCVRPEHFSIGTPEQRMDRMMAKRVRGGSSPGERNSQAKLTQEQVLAIRERYSLGHTSYRSLGNEFEVSAKTIGLIVRRLTWNSVADHQHKEQQAWPGTASEDAAQRHCSSGPVSASVPIAMEVADETSGGPLRQERP